MLSLVEIAELEAKQRGIVLFDSSAKGFDGFLKSVRSTKKYADLDIRLLNEAKKSTEEFLDFVTKKNTFTVEKVIRDFENLAKIMISTKKYFSKSQKECQPNSHNKNKIIFEEILYNIFQLPRLLQTKVFKPDNQKMYNLLYDAISYMGHPTPILQCPQPKHMQLYASSLYISLNKKVPITFIIKSWEFERGLVSLMEKLPSAMPKTFQSLDLQKYPIKLYVKSENNIYKPINITQNEKPAQRVHT